MRNGKFWNLLNQLLGSNCSKSNQRHRLRRILNLAIKDASEEAIVDNLIHRYIPTGPVATHPDYKGSLNPKLDSEFSTEEIRTALQDLGRSAPGPDGITNKLLRHFDDPSIRYFTETIHDNWNNGNMPVEWKTSHTTLFPKRC